MNSSKDFQPDWVSAPGDTISDLLGERGLSLSEFAGQMGGPFEGTKDLLDGRAAITIGVARQLVRVLGGSVGFWMSRDFQYRQDVATHDLEARRWLEELPVGDMIRFGWLKPVPHPSEEMAACLAFFDVPSVSAWREEYRGIQQLAAFRTSPSLDSSPASVAAWLREGEIRARGIECKPWDAGQFRRCLLDIRRLTRRREPGQFMPELQSLCAQSGVAVVIVRAPAGCRASGATRFLSSSKALLMLSFRYLTDDHFWFTFFHEAGHLVLHGQEDLFLEGEDTSSTAQETEADVFAANTLIPPEFQEELLALHAESRQVIRFSVRVGISPGIVVGQLQHHERLGHHQMNRLKRRFRWKD